MSDKKSSLPDINELSSMANKLFKDVKASVGEIIGTYKSKREHVPSDEPRTAAPQETKSAEPKAEPKKKAEPVAEPVKKDDE